jgi:transcription elongation factor Elf1
VSANRRKTSGSHKMKTTISMLDQTLFELSCGHTVVLGRLAHSKTWTCETCGKSTDLSADPYKAALAHDLDTANQIDAQARARGEILERLD